MATLNFTTKPLMLFFCDIQCVIFIIIIPNKVNSEQRLCLVLAEHLTLSSIFVVWFYRGSEI